MATMLMPMTWLTTKCSPTNPLRKTDGIIRINNWRLQPTRRVEINGFTTRRSIRTNSQIMRQHNFRLDGPHDWLCRTGIALCSLGFATLLFAHDPGLSVATARLEPAGLTIHLAMSPSDVEQIVPLDANHDGAVSTEELAVAQPQLVNMGLNAFDVSEDGQRVTATKSKVQCDDTGAVQFEISYPQVMTGELTIRSGLVGNLARGHRQFLSIRDHAGKLLGEEM